MTFQGPTSQKEGQTVNKYMQHNKTGSMKVMQSGLLEYQEKSSMKNFRGNNARAQPCGMSRYSSCIGDRSDVRPFQAARATGMSALNYETVCGVSEIPSK